MAEPETTTRDGSSRAAFALLVVLPFAAYALLLALAEATTPYRPSLDDPELLHLARYWAEHGSLDPGGLFLRVPFWQMLLGTLVGIVGERAAVLGVQAAAVLAALVLYARRAVQEAHVGAPACAAALLFAASPQVVLYSRHAVDELFLGALAMAVVTLGERPSGLRAALLGAIVAVAAMTKLAALLLVLPALWYLMRARDALPPARSFVSLALGFGCVALPLFGLAGLQRGVWLLDNTSAFNLGSLDQSAWLELADARARQAAGMASFWAYFGSDPLGYLASAAARSLGWLARPGSLDLFYWNDAYPRTLVELADGVVFFGIATLALVGTTRRTLPVWSFPLALWLACGLPQKTPYSPKITFLFPLLLLVPSGVASLRALLVVALGAERGGPPRVDRDPP